MFRTRALFLTLFFSACQIESCKASAVGPAVARLTARSAGVLTKLADKDTACGFSSDAVLAAPKVDGAKGGPGSVTWTVKGCALEFPTATTVLTNCLAVETTAQGKAVVSGTKTVTGTLTGNPANPVVPATADAVRFTLDATFDDFKVGVKQTANALTFQKGGLSWSAEPLLAVSASKGACAVPTTHLTLNHLRCADAELWVESATRAFAVHVGASDFSAQAGVRGDQQNWIAGEIQVFGQQVAFPAAGEDGRLDPDFEPVLYARGFDCAPDLQRPVTHVCPSLDDRVSQGAARLTVAAYGRLTDFFDDDPTCGFSSPAVVAGATLTGKTGERGGAATFTIAQPCTRTFAQPTAVKTDCFGAVTSFTGTVSAVGTKRVNGILTGDPLQPVIPTSRDPARVELTYTFTDFRLSDSVSTRALTISKGTLAGRLETRTALNSELGACSIKTPAATMTGLKYTHAALLIENDGSAFARQATTSALDAQNGTKGAVSNRLSGTMVLDGATVTIAPGALDPDFNQAHFDGAYACKPHLKAVSSEAECDFTAPLAAGAARLIAQSTGAIGTLANADKTCGFDTTSVKLAPTEVVGAAGQQGSMAWKITHCQLGQNGPAQLDQDCAGTKRVLSGTVALDARRAVKGLREKQLLFIDAIVPQTRDAVTLRLDAARLGNFTAAAIPAGATAPTAALTIHSGTLTATVKPVLGERRSKPGTFDVATPVSSLTQITLTNARVTLKSGPKTFVFAIPTATLDAFNGAYLGQTNALSGTVSIDGTPVTLGAMALNPMFSQAAFDQTYACTPDLASVVPPNGP